MSGFNWGSYVTIDLETTPIPKNQDERSVDILFIAIAYRDGQRKLRCPILLPGEESKKAVRDIFSDPDRVVIMFRQSFDHYLLLRDGYIEQDHPAAVHDVYILAWLLEPTIRGGKDLKALVRRHFDHRMMTYNEAFHTNKVLQELDGLLRLSRKFAELWEAYESLDDKEWAERALDKYRAEREKRVRASWADNTPMTSKAYADVTPTPERIDEVSCCLRTSWIKAKIKAFTSVAGFDSLRVQPVIDRAFTLDTARDIVTTLKQRIDALSGTIENLRHEATKIQWSYAAADVSWTHKLYYKLRKLVSAAGPNYWGWFLVESEVRRIMVVARFSGSYIDDTVVDSTCKVLADLMEEYKAAIYSLAKTEFSPGSDAQVRMFLFHPDFLAIAPPASGQNSDGSPRPDLTPKGATKLANEIVDCDHILREQVPFLSAASSTLSRVDHPIVRLIMNYRAAAKVYQAFATNFVASSWLRDGSRLFGTFNSVGTVSGRFSSCKPNLQNIPSRPKGDEYDEKVRVVGLGLRKAFIAPPGYKLIVADQSQVELRIASFISGDPNLLSAYTEYIEYNGTRYYTGDVHRKTAQALGITRKEAKAVNFGLIYAMSAARFARVASLFTDEGYYDIEKATEWRAGFFRLYPNIQGIIQVLNSARYSVFEFPRIGPPVRFTRPPRGWRDRGLSLDDIPGAPPRGSVIFNYLVQGSSAAILKFALFLIARYVLPKFPGMVLELQVHDEIAFRVPEEYAKKAAVLVKFAMEFAWFEVTGAVIDYQSLPLLSSCKICDTWAGKDDDNVPEVGNYYTRWDDGVHIYTPATWSEFMARPGKPLVKASVAVLSPKQRAYAEGVFEEAISRAPWMRFNLVLPD